ncbi:glycosyl transferase, group 1 family protein [Enterococcus haemoperoxidus ATCC BAA-382]|uniref:Glycosyl transferase, group 1 family protein n=1 Tax=Enterococcus haemoperoxidus ATCC BAA-382 TaxID=1158608 RepID=R2QUC6_9ENTE|nr:glycosyltransferase [Enterococcus haemoperoxidus]EOI00120.1 glycosyl transferase, group 1 family protein [Enterococcus haemoperoxidus ATCC BAA-382]EOT63182.1 glycosyl transferase, group 1 family protein [Enterococcus haemoperoxidus ATCC BAA-382]OJG50731.1 glycosyl transferase, group 1 family protein [Enterococcus haemoperoxidus]
MKVLLYFEGEKILAKSGIGRALEHQKRALSEVGIEYTLDADCTDYDILHINTYGINSHSMVKKAKKNGKKVIYHAHSTEEDFRNSFIGSNQISPLVKKYLVSLYSKADYLITPTPYSKELLEGYGITVPITSISNGIDLNRFERSEEKETKFREYFKIKENQKVIICVGLYFERKGIIDFVELAREMPNYRFIWFGHTPMYSIPKTIRTIVKEDHPVNVEFPGYIKGDIIEGAYSAADLFFFPSYEETEGIVILEALASKQQVLVRDIPVYKGWLKDKVNCYMGNNNEEFANLIEKLVENKIPNTCQAGYSVAKDKSIGRIGHELKNVYEKVLTNDAKEQEDRVHQEN